jgi:hypothetical protein
VVAMRIVNSLEREMVQSEWENWLADENSRCDQLQIHLEAGEIKAKAMAEAQGESPTLFAQRVVMGDKKDDRKSLLKSWHNEYCGSCRKDARALGEELKLSFQ